MEKTDTLIFRAKRTILTICCDDIVFFESDGHYVNIHTKDGKIHAVRCTIASIEKIADNDRFVRIHRGIIVNLQYVKEIIKADVLLDAVWGSVPVSRSYRDEFEKVLEKFDGNLKIVQ